MCRLFLRELAGLPIELDVYANGKLEEVPELQGALEGTTKRYLPFLYTWDWNAWYGRHRRTAFAMSFLKRLPLHGRIVRALLAEHRRRPYDAVIQFSQGELFSLGQYLDEIPVILFPCVHAAGELFWCRREEPLARRCEPWAWRKIRNGYLAYRARLQRRDYQRVRGVIGMSHRFNRWVERDYHVPPSRLGVVYHPIEAVTESRETRGPNGRIRLLFVGRISVRKGVELLVEVLPGILQAYPEAEMTIIGAGSLWSDYEALLDDLPKERCRWLKSLPNEEVVIEMRRSEILLIPSLYEPGGIVVGEALAHGVIVVASDEVGSAENLLSRVCHEFKAGDAAAFCAAIQQAIATVRGGSPELRLEAMKTAQAQFPPAMLAALLLEEVGRLVGLSSQCSSAGISS